MNEEIMKYYKLVYLALNQMKVAKKEQDDYFFYGLMGLYSGIETFDKTKGIKESTYYYKCIRNELRTRFAYNSRKKYDYRKYDISINTPLSETHTIEDTLISDVDIEEEYIKKEQFEIVVNELRKLKNTKWKQYLFEFYGIDTKQLTIQELSKKYGVKAHAIQSSIIQGIKRIRKKLEEKL